MGKDESQNWKPIDFLSFFQAEFCFLSQSLNINNRIILTYTFLFGGKEIEVSMGSILFKAKKHSITVMFKVTFRMLEPEYNMV